MSKSLPLVSILIICYQQEKFIGEAIEGALDQDYPNIEIVISDDQSLDNTAHIVSIYQEKFPNKIKFRITESNLGITGNCNHGLSACKGEYIVIQGGDDVFLPGKISAQVKWLEEKTSRVICYHDMEVFDNNSGKTLWYWSERFKLREGDVLTAIKYGAFMCSSSLMMKRSSCPHVQFDSRVSISSDWLFWIDFLSHSDGKIGYLPHVYGKYRRHDNNVTSSSAHEFHEIISTLDIVAESYPQHKKAISYRRAITYLVEAKRLFSKREFFVCLCYVFKSFFISQTGFIGGVITAKRWMQGRQV